jgi:hypothetical protein
MCCRDEAGERRAGVSVVPGSLGMIWTITLQSAEVTAPLSRKPRPAKRYVVPGVRSTTPLLLSPANSPCAAVAPVFHAGSA